MFRKKCKHDEIRASVRRQPLAIVTPWFGRELKGGAEQLSWQIAARLAERGHCIEVLTTCCRSFLDDWSNNYIPRGKTVESGFVIRRFKVNKRNRLAFDRLNAELLKIHHESLLPGVSPVQSDYSHIWSRENINSRSLVRFIVSHQKYYQAFIFIPYLYGLILHSLPLVADKAWLQPCLHDEVYAYLPEVADLFLHAKGLLFNSDGEMQLAAQLYGPIVLSKGMVVGTGIEFDALKNDSQLIPGELKKCRFVLCLGRRDPGKGTDFIVSAFLEYKKKNPNGSLKLVLAGPGMNDYGDTGSDVIDRGLVGEGEKVALLQCCTALFQPSVNESFSRVLFEAWHYGKPVVCHRDCLATANAVEAAGGGWVAATLNEWVRVIEKIEVLDEKAIESFGSKGKRYATEIADWEHVIDRYEKAIFPTLEESTVTSIGDGRKLVINQLLPNIAFGDAISEEALYIRNYLRSLGHHSEIFANGIDSRIAGEAKIATREAIDASDVLLYHHSIGSAVTEIAVDFSKPKCLIYHNITPASFFELYNPEFSRLLSRGREELPNLAGKFPYAVGDSGYNVAELIKSGFTRTDILPLAVYPEKWDEKPDEEIMRSLQDGRTNILFVGRYSPNKCQHQLIQAFAEYLGFELNARLILVGYGEQDDPYVKFLHDEIDSLELSSFVVMTGQINKKQLHSYYRTAHLFWSMSEHEGFCVPLVEAMWFDVPIMAYKSSAIPETLKDAGILFVEKESYKEISALAWLLAKDDQLRAKVLRRQRLRRTVFVPEIINRSILRTIKKTINMREGTKLTASNPDR